MLTGTALMNELVDELNELKLSTMAATLDELYHRPEFLEMDRLTVRLTTISPPVFSSWMATATTS